MHKGEQINRIRGLAGYQLQMIPAEHFDIDVDSLISEVAGNLRPLFSSGGDSPNAILGSYPNPKFIIDAQKVLIDVLLPGKMSPGVVYPDELDSFLQKRLNEAWDLLVGEIERAMPFAWLGEAGRVEGCKAIKDPGEQARCIMTFFYRELPSIRSMVTEDIRAAYEGDPAALSFAEVQLAYPGLLAILSHRLAHKLYNLDVPIVPRIINEWIHQYTGIDIHPGARIGHGLFIDHGTGVVIGETTEIGKGVKIYQGVTLGARSFPLDEHGLPIKHVKRHPTVKDNVILYSNASILGGSTIIGENSTIGANVFLMRSVPPGSVVSIDHSGTRIKPSASAD